MISQPSPGRSRLLLWAVCGLLFAGTLLLFSRAVGYGFTNYDDPIFVTQNPHVRAGLTWEGVTWAFTGRADYWHPLTWISHMLDWQLYGDRAAGHHMTSVLWHGANAVLVFLVMRRLTGAFWASALGAALFSWHPLRVESVAWITERKDVMSGFFFLLTLWAYAGYTDRRRAGGPAWRPYALTLALFLGGLMCKPMLVTLPVLLLVLDYWPLRRPGATWRALVIEKIPFFALSAMVSALTVVMQVQSAAFTLRLPLGARLGNAFVSVVRYTAKFLWPFDLTVIYPHPGYWPTSIVVGSVLLGVAATVAAWRQRGPRPWLLVGWLWFLVMILPAIGIVQVGFQAMADRYTYIPILGLQLALLWSLRELPVIRSRPWLTGAISSVLLLGCAARTWDQEATWRDSETLYRHAIAVTERNDTAHATLGFTLFLEGRVDEAASESRRALDANPANVTALTTLAAIQEQQGKFGDAAASCASILKLDPKNAEIEFSLGLLLLRMDRLDEATGHLKAAVTARPALQAKNLQDAAMELRGGHPNDAFVRYAAAIAINRRDAEAYVGLGLSFAKAGHSAEALTSFKAAVELQPDNADAHRAWADALAQGGNFGDAVPHYERAVQLRPADAGNHAALGYALFLTDRRGEAIAQWEEALRLDPNFPGLAERLRKVRASER